MCHFNGAAPREISTENFGHWSSGISGMRRKLLQHFWPSLREGRAVLHWKPLRSGLPCFDIFEDAVPVPIAIHDPERSWAGNLMIAILTKVAGGQVEIPVAVEVTGDDTAPAAGKTLQL